MANKRITKKRLKSSEGVYIEFDYRDGIDKLHISNKLDDKIVSLIDELTKEN